MSARVLRWLIFSIFFSLIPLGLDYLMALSRASGAETPGLVEIIGRGELCLISVTLSLVGGGEIYGAKIKEERISIALGGASFTNVVVGIAVYIMMKSAETPSWLQIVISLIVFGSTMIVATSCITATESRDV